MDNCTQNEFVIEKKIGAGAFGIVYKAYSNVLKGNVALKVCSNGKNLNEFKKEIVVLRRLSFYEIKGVVKYYGSGFCAELNTEYYSMELLNFDLKKFIETQKMSISEYMAFAFELYYTLYQFRKIEFKHRDITDKNVMVRTDQSPRLYLDESSNRYFVHSKYQPVIVDFNTSIFEPYRNVKHTEDFNDIIAVSELVSSERFLDIIDYDSENENTIEKFSSNLTAMGEILQEDDLSSTFIHNQILFSPIFGWKGKHLQK